MDMFEQLENINTRPEPFECYTAADLWTDNHTSEQMLAYHLNADIDVSSRRVEFIDQSVASKSSQELKEYTGPGNSTAVNTLTMRL